MPKKSLVAKPIKETPKNVPYVVSVFTAGKAYHANGKTIAEALSNINIDTFKAKAILQVKHDERKKEIVLHPFLFRKLIQPQQRTFFEKRLQILLR